MAEGDNQRATQSIADGAKVTETLSQFIARVLNQLSLSAWLPSAALVMSLTFIIQLGDALDHASPEPDARSPVIRALRTIAGISLGGALLLIGAVIVLTMVAQAFSFEAIRILEGYWGTNSVVERIARRRCSRHRRHRERLDGQLKTLTRIAWIGTYMTLRRMDRDLHRRGKPEEFSPRVLHMVGHRLLGEPQTQRLSPAEQADVDYLEHRWWTWAPADVRRRHVNVQKRLDDLPEPSRMLPTRLGNVLRHHEDKTGVADVETFMQRIFDDLPLSMRIDHDEHRTRLDLYCSMVFVVAVVTAVAAARFAGSHWEYVAYALALGFSAAWLMYRAAIASARAFGGILVNAARLSPHGNHHSPEISPGQGADGQ